VTRPQRVDLLRQRAAAGLGLWNRRDTGGVILAVGEVWSNDGRVKAKGKKAAAEPSPAGDAGGSEVEQAEALGWLLGLLGM
jgi:hypothetical protein